MDPPGYQAITADQIGVATLRNGAGTVRVIAGEYLGVRGPARTFTPVTMLDIRLEGMGRAEFTFRARHNAALLVMKGRLRVNGEDASENELVVFANAGEHIASRRNPTPRCSCSRASRSTNRSCPTVRS